MSVPGSIKKNKLEAAKNRRLERGKKKMEAKQKRRENPNKKWWF